MKTIFTILITAALAITGTWFALNRPSNNHVATTETPTRKLLYYQCAMHPQVKSDKPGRCTICGMELTPIYEGGGGHNSESDSHVVALTQNQIQVLHVQTSEAKNRPLTRNLTVAGIIEENSIRHRILAAYVDGRMDQLHVNYVGAEVEQGQPLAEIYSPSLLQAEREYRQLSGDLRKNTALRLRQMGLTPTQIDTLDQKPADALTSQILSPISGTVVSQSIYEGQYVNTGEQLFEIADFSTMWFNFRAYEQDIPWIKTGFTVHVTTPSLPDKTFTGKITFIDPNFDEATRSTTVRVELANPLVNGRRELLNRLYADGSVELAAPSVLTVPRTAVLETGSEAVAYIDHSDGNYERTVIKIGRRGDSLLEILSGLKEGDQVVTNGNLLIDGQAEMNRSFTAPTELSTPSTASLDLNQTQKDAIAGFIKTADAMAAALADDDLASFRKTSNAAMQSTTNLLQQLKPVAKNLDALNAAQHMHEINDLPSARAAFHQFSVAATAVLEPLRHAGQAPDFHIFECSMVNQAIPGVSKKARWIQLIDRKMANPFFGKEMSDCGVEIKR